MFAVKIYSGAFDKYIVREKHKVRMIDVGEHEKDTFSFSSCPRSLYVPSELLSHVLCVCVLQSAITITTYLAKLDFHPNWNTFYSA